MAVAVAVAMVLTATGIGMRIERRVLLGGTVSAAAAVVIVVGPARIAEIAVWRMGGVAPARAGGEILVVSVGEEAAGLGGLRTEIGQR